MSSELASRTAACNGVLESWPGVSVQVSLLPDNDIEEFLNRLVGSDRERSGIQGVILCRCPREVKEFFVASGLPTVVNGHVEEDIELPYVDRDQAEVGRLLADHLLDRGHRRIGLLMYDRWFAGDSLLVSGIQRSMGERQLAADDLAIRSVPGKPDMVRRAVEDVLSGPNRVTAVIARVDAMAVECLAVAQGLGLCVPDDLAIVSAGEGGTSLLEADPSITGSVPAATEIGHLLGETLARVCRGEAAGRLHFEYPVEIIHRKSS